MAYTPVNDGDLAVASQLQQVIDSLSGVVGAGQPISITTLESATDYALALKNLGSGGLAFHIYSSSGADLFDSCDASTSIDNGTIFVDHANNRVGINDTTPTATLDINGSLAVSGAATFGSVSSIGLGNGAIATPSLYFADQVTTGIYKPATHSLAIASNGVQRLLVNTSGTTVEGLTLSSATLGYIDMPFVSAPSAPSDGTRLYTKSAAGGAYVRSASGTYGTSERELADLTSTQTLAAKTLTSPTINGGTVLTGTWADSQESQNYYAHSIWNSGSNYPGYRKFSIQDGTLSAPVANSRTIVGSGATILNTDLSPQTAFDFTGPAMVENHSFSHIVTSNCCTADSAHAALAGVMAYSYVPEYHNYSITGSGVGAIYGAMFRMADIQAIGIPASCVHGSTYSPTQQVYVQPLTAVYSNAATVTNNGRALYTEATAVSNSGAVVSSQEITVRHGAGHTVDAAVPGSTQDTMYGAVIEMGILGGTARWGSAAIHIAGDGTANGAWRTGINFHANGFKDYAIDMGRMSGQTLPTAMIRLPNDGLVSARKFDNLTDVDVLKVDTGDILNLYSAVGISYKSAVAGSTYLEALPNDALTWQGTTNGTLSLLVNNTNTGAQAAANARLDLKVGTTASGGSGLGDPYILFTIANEFAISLGPDNSDGNTMKWTAGSFPGEFTSTAGDQDYMRLNAAGLTLATGALEHKQVATPATPSAGFTKLYSKSDDNWYKLTDGGDEVLMLDANLLSAAGTMLYASADEAPAALAIGANKTMLASTGSAPSWSASPTLSGSLTVETGLNLGSATGAGTGAIRASGTIRSGGKVFAGNQEVMYYNVPAAQQNVADNADLTLGALQGVVLVHNFSAAQFRMVASVGGAAVSDIGGTAGFGTIGTDPGDTGIDSGLAIIASGGNLIVRNRTGATQSVGVQMFGAG